MDCVEGRTLDDYFPALKIQQQSGLGFGLNEVLYRILIETVSDYAIILLSAEGIILSWSVGAERIEGYKSNEIIGRHFAAFYRREDIRQNKPQKLLEDAAEMGRVEDEGWRLRKDGTRFWANVILTALRDRAGRLCGFGKVVRDATRRKRAQEGLRNLNEKLDQRVHERASQLAQTNRELRSSLAQLHALAARIQAVREDERTTIAREIHDDLGQVLTAMKMDLVWLMRRLPPDQAIQAKAESMLKLIDNTITSVRRIATTLRPGMLDDLGLAAAIEWQTQDFQERSGIKCTLDMQVGDLVLDDAHSTAVFRIFQETLTNVARHSGATRVSIKLKKTEQELILEVRDNGRGFRLAVGANKRSMGLLGMKERALLLGGRCDVRGTPGRGTVVTLRVPRRHRAKMGSKFT
jgi:PAS domain S-box-containing protein